MTGMQSSYLYLNDLRVHYLRWDAADREFPVVLLHGLSSSGRIWELVAPHLAEKGLTCYAPDARGHGFSDKPEDNSENYGFACVTSDLSAFLEVCQLDRPLLVGHSWGGMLALEYAARKHIGERAPRGIVLVDGGITQMDDREGETWESLSVRLAPPRLEGMTVETFMRMIRKETAGWQPAEAVFPILLADFEVDEDDKITPRLTYERHMRILRAIWDFKAYTRFSQVRCPVLMVPARPADPQSDFEQNWVAAKERGVALAQERIQNLQVAWMEDTIHDIPLQRPAELATLIANFALGLG
jgi:pimeloyl-ACP methyl ester carboxylesterase